MIICPFVKESCLKGGCLAWEEDRCLIFSFLRSSKPIKLNTEEEPVESVIPEEVLYAEVTTLANEMADFLLKEDPDLDFVYHRRDLVNKFWREMKGVKDPELVPRNFDEKMDAVANKVGDIMTTKRVPDFLKNESKEEITQRVMKWMEQQGPDYVLDTTNRFWDAHKINRFRVPPQLQSKLTQVDQLVWEHIREKKQAEKAQAIAEERAHIPEIAKQAILWLKGKQLESMTKDNLKLFLSEKGLKLAPDNRQALYIEINNALRENK